MAESYLSQLGDFMLIDSSKSPLNGVIFHNVQNIYPNDNPIKCVYSITENVKPDLEDLIGLFKVGWVSPSEIYSSVPAKFPVSKEKSFLYTLFDAHKLPSDSTDYYQFCYISKNSDVVGASTPFMFEGNELIAVEDPADLGLVMFKSRICQIKEELHKLTTEKNYYECKCELANNNLLKLKTEFDKLEQELNSKREATKQLEESNLLLNNKLEVFEIRYSNKKEGTVSDEKITKVDSKKNIGFNDKKEDKNAIACDHIIKSDAVNINVWKSLYEIYEVVVEVKHSFKSNRRNQVRMSYRSLVDYILDVFTSTKRKFQINSSGTIDTTKHCSCYFKQKAFCCPSLCSEQQFAYMMEQPTYTSFSNFNHYTEDGNKHCDGSFDPSSLTEYVQSLLHHELTNNSTMADTEKVSNVICSEDYIKNISEERDKANAELSAAKENIAALNSQNNVLQLELVGKQSVQVKESQNLTTSINKQSSLTCLDIESILQSVNNQYIILKEKYNELSKKLPLYQSSESRCAFLENENKKLKSYFNLERDTKDEPLGSDTCCELENIARKQKTESMLVNLQRESVGKISPNLLGHAYQERSKEE